MIANIIRLFAGLSAGVTGFFITPGQTENISLLTHVDNAFSWVIRTLIGILTIIFLFYQIKKIKRDLSTKKNK